MKGSVVVSKLRPPASEAKAMSRTATLPRSSRGLGSLRGEAKARSKSVDDMRVGLGASFPESGRMEAMALLARGARGAAAAMALGALLAAGTKPLAIGEARADEVKVPVAATVSAGTTGPACVLAGTEPVPKGLQIFDAPSGGRAIGSFSGAFASLRLSELPADPTTDRARVSTSLGSGSVRLDGWVVPATIPVYTARD